MSNWILRAFGSSPEAKDATRRTRAQLRATGVLAIALGLLTAVALVGWIVTMGAPARVLPYVAPFIVGCATYALGACGAVAIACGRMFAGQGTGSDDRLTRLVDERVKDALAKNRQPAGPSEAHIMRQVNKAIKTALQEFRKSSGLTRRDLTQLVDGRVQVALDRRRGGSSKRRQRGHGNGAPK